MKTIVFIACFVFMAEVGCLLRSACLVSQYGKFNLFLGTLTGTGFAAIVGIYLGDLVGQSLPHGVMHWISGFILVAIGALMIFDNHTCTGH